MAMTSTKTLIAASAVLALASFTFMNLPLGALASTASLGLAALSLALYAWAMVRDFRKTTFSSAEADRAGDPG